MYTPVEMMFTVILASIVLDEKLTWQQGTFFFFKRLKEKWEEKKKMT